MNDDDGLDDYRRGCMGGFLLGVLLCIAVTLIGMAARGML